MFKCAFKPENSVAVCPHMYTGERQEKILRNHECVFVKNIVLKQKTSVLKKLKSISFSSLLIGNGIATRLDIFF